MYLPFASICSCIIFAVGWLENKAFSSALKCVIHTILNLPAKTADIPTRKTASDATS